MYFDGQTIGSTGIICKGILMKITIMEQDQELSLFELTIDQQTSATLRTASQWGRFLAIMGFVLGALILIFGIVLYGKITSTYNGFRSDYGSGIAQKLAMRYLIVCMLFAAVMVTGAIFTLSFSNRVVTALR